MIKKVLKALGLFFIMWFVSMLTIESNFKYKHTFVHHKVNHIYKNIKSNWSTESAFKVWRSIKPAKLALSSDEKIDSLKVSTLLPPGENGTPVFLEDISNLKHYVRMLVNKGWREHAFNQYVSDMISLKRSLPDVRDVWCKKVNYSQHLPTASIIICFHNEAWSTLLRTLHSVLNRSPLRLINEIILFDDFSTMEHLRSNLEEYVRKWPKVILVKSAKREGLIRARMKAMKYTTGSVLVYLDSHCECNKGWLEPLLDRIAKDPQTVVSPAVDLINENTFKYTTQDTFNLRIGGFTWDLKFIWMLVPHQMQLERPNPAAPIKTPTISGGLFAIDKVFFKKIGFYDKELDTWGGENLELSFKTWMCGGTLEIVPCSHVGHVFRKRIPYKKEDSASLNKNLLRVAEVWMDDYKKYFLERIGNTKIYLKDINTRKKLRDNLNCKSFEWYLKNVFPQLEVPDKYAASGVIHNLGYKLCLDLSLVESYTNIVVKLLPCHNSGGNQFWVYTRHGQIKRDEYCLEYTGIVLQMYFCGEDLKYQQWLYNNMTRLIKHIQSKKCLQITKSPKGDLDFGYTLSVDKCVSPALSAQQWLMQKFIFERLDPSLYTH